MKTHSIHSIFCMLLIVCLLSTGFSAHAAYRPTDSIQYNGTDCITASLTISSSGLASCSGTITLSYSSYSADMALDLQRYSGGSWHSVKSWSASDVTSMHKSYYVTHGYSYRVVASATVYNASGYYVESPSATSPTVYY